MFKKSIRDKGLYQEYENLSEFQLKFRRQLAQTVISRFPSSARETDASISDVSDERRDLIPIISAAARELLVEASADTQGVIMSLQMIGGSTIQTNGKNFLTGADARSEARWRRAVTELEGHGLIEDRGGQREVFHVTDEGYRVADIVKRQA